MGWRTGLGDSGGVGTERRSRIDSRHPTLTATLVAPGMADTLTPSQRSALMSRIRSKDTQPEMIVRRILHGMGYRYVLHDKRLCGKPDLVFPSRRKVVFVHGCFWHGHACSMARRPKTNAAFWSAKFEANRRRDARDARRLRRLGWGVLTVRECATRMTDLGRLQWRLIAFLED